MCLQGESPPPYHPSPLQPHQPPHPVFFTVASVSPYHKPLAMQKTQSPQSHHAKGMQAHKDGYPKPGEENQGCICMCTPRCWLSICAHCLPERKANANKPEQQSDTAHLDAAQQTGHVIKGCSVLVRNLPPKHSEYPRETCKTWT
jgi:hypothetical protein